MIRRQSAHRVCACRPVLMTLLSAGLAIAACFCSDALAAKRSFDLKHSMLRVRVFKTGLFSALGHDHEIEAPLAQGELDDGANPSVSLRAETARLRVADPGVSEKDRAEIQKTMQGIQVLDIASFPEIRFASATVTPAGASRWNVTGNLSLHGQTHSVNVDVTLKDGVYRGSAAFKQSEFGIKPVSAVGGTVKVKDEVKIEFEVGVTP
jgi:polyisoprenoid-binding protein YceI